MVLGSVALVVILSPLNFHARDTHQQKKKRLEMSESEVLDRAVSPLSEFLGWPYMLYSMLHRCCGRATILPNPVSSSQRQICHGNTRSIICYCCSARDY